MTISTWSQSANSNYNDPGNWSATVPGSGDTAEFEASGKTNISIVSAFIGAGEWLFNPGAGQYNFEISLFSDLLFDGAGITINAGSAHLLNFGVVGFFSGSTAGGALIDNFGFIEVFNSSTLGVATIHTFGGGGRLVFFPNGTGGSAQLVTDAGGIADFSGSAGHDGLGHMTVGSIAGAGTYKLGHDQLMVGLNGLSSEVSGPIEDGGDAENAGSGGSLVKVGPGTLKLSYPGNTYSGGTILEGGAFDVAAIGAAGTGGIAFAGKATLEIEKASFSGHVFGNPIYFFGKHDVLDLTGLHFHAGATATYHKAAHHLTIHSASITDTLTILSPHSPHGTHFEAASDHHGGTEVFLIIA